MTTLAVESVLRSLVLAAMVWAGIKLFRVRNVLAQKIAWGLVLLISFAMPGLIRWQAAHPRAALVVPVKRTATITAIERRASAVRTDYRRAERLAAAATTDSAVSFTPIVSVAPSHPVKVWHLTDLFRYALPVYLVVSGVLLLRLLFGLAMAVRIWSRAEMASPILEPRATVRISEDIQSPVTIGSGIVLPIEYEEWDRAKLRLVLAHERSHVRQGDFYLQLLASLYAALVWFSPLGWWLKRRLSELGEALSDHAALMEADDNSSYAEVLLEFAAMPRHGFAGVTAGVGMARSSNIHDRIERILNDRIFRSAFLYGRRHAAIAAVLVPAGLVLATSLLHVQAAERVKAKTIAALKLPVGLKAQLQTVEEKATTLLTPAAPQAAVPAYVPESASATVTKPVTPVAPVMTASLPAAPAAWPSPSPVSPAAPKMAISGPSGLTLVGPSGTMTLTSPEPDQHHVFRDDGDDDDSFVIVDRDKGSAYAHNGSWGDGGKADRAGKKISGSFIWFESDGKSYVITDPSVIAKAKSLYAPQEELGRKQEELGKQQEELGRLQEEAAKRMEEVRVQVPDLSKELDELQRKIQKLSSQATQENLSDMQEKLSEMQSKLGEAQSQAGEKQSELGEQQSELGRKQGELGEKQGELGREQGEVAREATERVRSMIDQAYRDGKAKPVE